MLSSDQIGTLITALGAGIGFALALALCGMGSAALWKARRTR